MKKKSNTSKEPSIVGSALAGAGVGSIIGTVAGKAAVTTPHRYDIPEQQDEIKEVEVIEIPQEVTEPLPHNQATYTENDITSETELKAQVVSTPKSQHHAVSHSEEPASEPTQEGNTKEAEATEEEEDNVVKAEVVDPETPKKPVDTEPYKIEGKTISGNSAEDPQDVLPTAVEDIPSQENEVPDDQGDEEVTDIGLRDDPYFDNGISTQFEEPNE